MSKSRQNMLLFAEALDAWRVIPRLMVLAYGYLVFNLYIWYKSIPTYAQEKCDPAVLAVLMGKGMAALEAKAYACTVVGVVGGPTVAQTTFVTTIVSLSAGIFGLYTTTGRKWEHWDARDRRDDYPDDDYNGGHRRGRDDRDGPDVENRVKAKTSIQIFAQTPQGGDTPEVMPAEEEPNGPTAPDIEEESPRP